MTDVFETKLVVARKKLRQAIEESLLIDERIIGAFYDGSIAENQQDAYSDIDLRLLVSQEIFEQFNQFKLALVKQWGTVVFLRISYPIN